MPTQDDQPTIALQSDFKFGTVDGLLKPPPSGLGPLAPMVGSWRGNGFNTIFRPFNPNKSPNPLPVAVPGTDNILELNLTSESTSFTAIAGLVPNRGEVQADISLSGMIYLQQISDVTTQPSTGIHIEPGIWIVVPATTNPAEGPTVARMASIPHGTTINAQGTTKPIVGAPVIPVVDITPNFIGGAKNRFESQTATAQGTARIPQDLTKFIANESITQAMLDDPNSVLRAAIAGQTIVSATQVLISTSPASPLFAGGTDNIAFLVNTGPDTVGSPNGPNANAVQMTATFWIETVEKTITIPPFKLGGAAIPLDVGLRAPPGQAAPKLSVNPNRDVAQATQIKLQFTQIQYSQLVILNFNGLSWPHVSVATLIPSAPVTVPPAAWG